ncbi:hypothetical protein BOTBODRAFT_39776 [Botryobasidium botryosum FD-172 SS1]|uniref:Secreted protein n=1 Tax=Botryobasidium botryosum (strain FD-172 SS1) TaxID=930990 RepID=A0A067LSX7_BOTB1|nr:hypothetical protein BOTBODRAFT_39776 [Botryobasidium botryosum FD-172 SS1]
MRDAPFFFILVLPARAHLLTILPRISSLRQPVYNLPSYKSSTLYFQDQRACPLCLPRPSSPFDTLGHDTTNSRAAQSQLKFSDM